MGWPEFRDCMVDAGAEVPQVFQIGTIEFLIAVWDEFPREVQALLTAAAVISDVAVGKALAAVGVPESYSLVAWALAIGLSAFMAMVQLCARRHLF